VRDTRRRKFFERAKPRSTRPAFWWAVIHEGRVIDIMSANARATVESIAELRWPDWHCDVRLWSQLTMLQRQVARQFLPLTRLIPEVA